MNQMILHTPEGLRDIYAGECERKQILEQRIHQVLVSYGYRDIETPTFEYFDVFSKEVGTIPSKDLFKFFDREGSTLVLRPDFTPSIARAASRYFRDAEHTIRLCYQGNTFVNYSSLQGRMKENTQMGAELIGELEVDADAEAIALATECMKISGLRDFQISIANAAFFESLAEEAGISPETAEELRVLIRNHNTFGVNSLAASLDIDEKTAHILTSLTTLAGGREVLDRASDMTQGLEAHKAVMRLTEVFELLRLYGLEEYVNFDFGMLSAYNYYTGIIFRGYTYGTGEALVKGGRYDTLLSHFGMDAPAIGFAVVTGQLMNALQRQKIEILPEHERYLILYHADSRALAHKKAVAYRAQGKCAELMLIDEEETYSDDFYRREGGYAAVVRL